MKWIRLSAASRITKNAVALMVSTTGSAALGVAFWIVAAHLFSERSVGRGAAQISAMTLLAQVAQLNLSYAFVRFLPQAGTRARRLVKAGYCICSVVGAGVATVFVLTPLADDVLPAGWAPGAVFVAAVATWTIFVVQDGVLTGLRRAVWVPIENTLFGAGKLALLPVFSLLALGQSLFLSWTVPVVPTVAVVTFLLFTRLLPTGSTARAAGPYRNSLSRRAATSFLGAQYVVGLASAASSFLVPLIVIKQLGASANAHFFFPWLLGIALGNLFGNVVASFIVEAAHAEEQFRRLFWRAVRLMGLVVTAGMVLTIIAGPLLLRMLVDDYADAASTLIRWIGLSLPFSAVIWLAVAGLWMQQRFWLLAALESAATMVLIALTLALVDGSGIDAPGIARFAQTALFAALCLPLVVRWYRTAGDAPPSTEPVPMLLGP